MTTKVIIDMQSEEELTKLQEIILDDMIHGSDAYKKCVEKGKLVMSVKIGKEDMDILKTHEEELRTLIMNSPEDHILRNFLK